MFFFLILSTATAQLQITSAGGPFSILFDATVSGVSNGQFSGTGFQATPSSGQLDSDAWAGTGVNSTPTSFTFGGTATTNDWARGANAGGGKHRWLLCLHYRHW